MNIAFVALESEPAGCSAGYLYASGMSFDPSVGKPTTLGKINR